MDTTKIIEAIQKLNELQLQEVIEATQSYAKKNNMDHLFEGDHDWDQLNEDLRNLEYQNSEYKKEIIEWEEKVDKIKESLENVLGDL